MSDNFNTNCAETLSADDIDGIKHQRVKLEFGENNTAVEVSELNPLPVISSGDPPIIVVRDNLDAFGRVRISEPFTLFDGKQIYDKNTLLFTELVSGVGATSTYMSNQASTRMTVGTVSGERVVRQSKNYFPYQPGKSFLIMATGVLGGASANCVRRIGYFDDDNGLFFELNGSVLRVVKRSKTTGSVVDTAVEQDDWNIDKLDGTGDSGITLDTTKTQIFIIDFQWLGVGKVRFGFSIDDKIYYCHQMFHANVLDVVYISTPNLPVRYEIVNTGTASGSTSMYQICSSVMSEGGYSPIGMPRSADRGITATGNIGSTLTPIITIRLKSTFKHAFATKLGLHIFNAGNAVYKWALLLNPTVTGGNAASWVSISNSIMEYDITRNGAVSSGVQIVAGYGAGSTKEQLTYDIESPLALGTDLANVTDELILAAQTTSGTDTYYGSLTWSEYI